MYSGYTMDLFLLEEMRNWSRETKDAWGVRHFAWDRGFEHGQIWLWYTATSHPYSYHFHIFWLRLRACLRMAPK